MKKLSFQEFKEYLASKGVEDFKGYTLINNYGYTFKYKGVKYDLRHVLNVYGADVDWWDLTPKNDALAVLVERIKMYDRKGS